MWICLAHVSRIIAVYCHKYGRILTQLDKPNVMAVQMFRSTFACVALHVSAIQLMIRF